VAVLLEVNGIGPGTIPATIGTLTSSVTFYLFNNKVNGSIPSEVGLMTSLTFFDTGSNSMIGSIPSEVGLNADDLPSAFPRLPELVEWVDTF